jgi:hypothetical protein
VNREGHSYCIYYGWLVADGTGAPAASARRLAELRPRLLIAAPYTATPSMPNLSKQVVTLLQAADVHLLAYVDVSYRQRPLREVLAEARAALTLGADGILFDQVEHRWRPASAGYYSVLADAMHQLDATVAFNTGVAETDEEYMDLANLLMVEHRWRDFARLSPWRHRYDPLRFMGVSSNEPGAARWLGTAVDQRAAVAHTREAWAAGLGWHCATDRFVELPPWTMVHPTHTPPEGEGPA